MSNYEKDAKRFDKVIEIVLAGLLLVGGITFCFYIKDRFKQIQEEERLQPKQKQITNRDIFKQLGLIDRKFFLHKAKPTTGIEGKFSGYFEPRFLGTGKGEFNGAFDGGDRIKFLWFNKEGELICNIFPPSKFKFILDDKVEVPTVEFQFDEPSLNDWYWTTAERQAYIKTNTCEFIQKHFQPSVIIVRISKELFDRDN